MKIGNPIPVKFSAAVEKWLRMYAIEKDITLSDAIREMVNRGRVAVESDNAPPAATSPRRRVLSKGVG